MTYEKQAAPQSSVASKTSPSNISWGLPCGLLHMTLRVREAKEVVQATQLVSGKTGTQCQVCLGHISATLGLGSRHTVDSLM